MFISDESLPLQTADISASHRCNFSHSSLQYKTILRNESDWLDEYDSFFGKQQRVRSFCGKQKFSVLTTFIFLKMETQIWISSQINIFLKQPFRILKLHYSIFTRFERNNRIKRLTEIKTNERCKRNTRSARRKSESYVHIIEMSFVRMSL